MLGLGYREFYGFVQLAGTTFVELQLPQETLPINAWVTTHRRREKWPQCKGCVASATSLAPLRGIFMLSDNGPDIPWKVHGLRTYA